MRRGRRVRGSGGVGEPRKEGTGCQGGSREGGRGGLEELEKKEVEVSGSLKKKELEA